MNPTTITFEVVGDPTPQGSKTKMPNGAMLEGGTAPLRAKRKDWRNAVADAARAVAAIEGKLDGNLQLSVTFRFPMPQSRPKKVRDWGWAWKNTAPDLDKLVRSVGDSLTASGLIRDDARIAAFGQVLKIETDSWCGAVLTLRHLPDPHDYDGGVWR